MEKYKIAYIDDAKKSLIEFQLVMEGDFEIIALHPMADLFEMVEYLFKLDINAVIVDHRLTVYKKRGEPNIPYDGVDLIKAILSERHLFPCFVLTGFEEEAIDFSQDVNFIYSKKVITTPDNEKEKSVFKKKIHTQIDHYLSSVQGWEQEFNDLVLKSQSTPLNAPEEGRLFELDTLLAHAIDKKHALPKHLKEPTNLKKLDELIKTTNDLLHELKKDK